jgi:methylmalonyl-CoA/ethylmalonyl-CoA epimerase
LIGVGLVFHHVGVLVKDVAAASPGYINGLGYESCSDIVHDPRQTAFVRFLRLAGENSYLELVSPDGPGSVLSNALRKGGGIHHLCYATSDLEHSLQRLASQGLLLLRTPEPAVAFGGRKIAWMLNRDHLLIELVEQGPVGQI